VELVLRTSSSEEAVKIDSDTSAQFTGTQGAGKIDIPIAAGHDDGHDDGLSG